MNISRLNNYHYRGARAMVIMHDEYLRECIDVWEEFDKSAAKLPVTKDQDYQSKIHLLRHILRASRGYMVWTCEMLKLPDPDIPPTPEVDKLQKKYRDYLENLLEKWIHPLREVTEDGFFLGVYESRWKKPYTIDSMLEHAVMHPLRHTFQMRELMKK
ncbi:hypothetical protein ACFLQV_01970 [Calditrichota bacterium]